MANLSPAPVTETLLLSFESTADLCGMSQQVIRRLIKTDSFPAPIKCGPGPRGTIRFNRASILKWIENGCQLSEQQ